MLGNTEALFVNGFIFDELPVSVVMAAVAAARQGGATTFFDPGPRAWTLRQGERKKGLDAILDASDVVLMTQVAPAPLSNVK
jgi:sugar/nucleoside kinase (ribokinase family)